MYRSPNIAWVIKSKRLRWACDVARMEGGRSAFKMLTGKPTGKIPLGRPGHRWEDSIKMDIKKYVSTRGIGLILFRIRDS